MAKKPEEKEKPIGYQAIGIDLSLTSLACLKRLLLTGLYGASIEEVAQRLIEERLRSMVSVQQ